MSVYIIKAVHLPHQQIVYFRGNESENKQQELVQNSHETTLTQWFKINEMEMKTPPSYSPKSTEILYQDMPKYYTWQSKTWKRRKNTLSNVTIGRMEMSSPSQGERYYLRLLLLNVRSAISFENLRYFDGMYLYQIFSIFILQHMCTHKHTVYYQRCVS